MRMRKLMIATVAVVVGALGTDRAVVAQQAVVAQHAGVAQESIDLFTPSGEIRVAPMNSLSYAFQTANRQSRAAIDQARRALREAKTDEARGEATGKLREALGEYFDKDMDARKQSLEDLRERVAEMEKLLQKRQTAKTDIVALQLQMFTQEADGLGFFGGSSEPLIGVTASGSGQTAIPHVLFPMPPSAPGAPTPVAPAAAPKSE